MTSNSKDSVRKDKTDTLHLGEYESIAEFSKNGLAQIIDATKCTNAYPQGAIRDLYCAYPSFGRVIDEQSHRLLGLISKVLKWQNIRGNIQLRQQDEQFELLLECNDTIFERLQSNLDELAGVKRRPDIIVESRLKSSAKTASSKAAMTGSWNFIKSPITSNSTAKLVTLKNIDRPQKKFQTPVDNSSTHPFTPKLKYKPNAIKPLAILPEYDQDGNIISYLHPYEFELTKFDNPIEALSPKAVDKFKDINATTLTFVDTEEKLRETLQEFQQVTELAIDVEHHAHRSFMGFTCLMQISTKFKDYIFDALALREELHILNEILTDPKVVKIFHGADYDIEWLQRDLSLYVVNMFDTHQAARTLNFARFSLAYLLKHYCDIEVDKSFQLADWRIRPLPNELIAYARQDTHYLIYIYENLINDLWRAGNQEPKLLRSVLQRSTELCKRRYMKPVITPESHLDMYRKSKKLFDNRQLYALREIFQWRDSVARNEDESYNFVLPNHMMMQIAENLPREMQGILACCNPIPPLVKQHLQVLHQIILKARQQSVKPGWLENEPIHRGAYLSLRDYNSKLYCPHDLTHCEEFREDLPTLLKFQNGQLLKNEENMIQSPQNQMAKPILSIFDRLPNIHEQMKAVKIKQNDKLLLPYRRYLAVLPTIEREIRQEAARIEAENNRKQLCPTDSNASIEKTVAADISETKSEKKQQQNATNSESIRKFLKRKYETSLNKKSSCDVDQKTENDNLRNRSKRIKTDTAQHNSTFNDDKLSFTSLPKQCHQSQLAKGKSTSTVFTLKTNNNSEISTLRSGTPMSDKDQPTSSRRNQLDSRMQMSKRKKIKSCSKSFQSSDKPVIIPNFHYSTADFKKFQGGAQKINCIELEQQDYKKRNSRIAQSKQLNKLFTFSKVKSVIK